MQPNLLDFQVSGFIYPLFFRFVVKLTRQLNGVFGFLLDDVYFLG